VIVAPQHLTSAPDSAACRRPRVAARHARQSAVVSARIIVGGFIVSSRDMRRVDGSGRGNARSDGGIVDHSIVVVNDWCQLAQYVRAFACRRRRVERREQC
jgi:hypothetical protein